MPSSNAGFMFITSNLENFFYMCGSKLSRFLLVIQDNPQIKEAKMYNLPHSYCTTNLLYSVTSTTIISSYVLFHLLV